MYLQSHRWGRRQSGTHGVEKASGSRMWKGLGIKDEREYQEDDAVIRMRNEEVPK